ncbi:MAG: SUMF1/EgtB/PvdO family nonheme iron enzyme [Bacteroides sp.]|nr:SUMF1/EgtB/PvdO family nonheme iron enzyme [Bacteroides sp.]
MKKLLYVMTGLCLLAGIFTGCEKEEKANSTIKGVVTDKETSEPLSGVMIELQPVGKRVQTAEDGSYIIDRLKAGAYTLYAQKDSYVDYKREEIQLTADETLSLDIEMEEPFVKFQILDVEGDSIEEMGCGVESSFRLKNVGNIAGEWRMEWEADWITEITPNSGSLAAGASETITMKKKLLEADKETVLIVKTDKENLRLKVVSKGFEEMELVYVEGGTFEMGATAEQGEDAQDDEKPVRTIKLDSYHIGKYEVTQTQWKAVMGTDPSEFKGDNRPVEMVSWEEAQEFCKKLSEATGMKYVLPTEAQWEYAARGGNKSQHYKYAGSNDIGEVAWYVDNSYGETHPVGTKKANELGIYDMSGNVWEWCLDWYADQYDENDIDNPQGSKEGEYRVARGCSWMDYSVINDDVTNFYRVSSRGWGEPDIDVGDIGFRVAVLP